MPHAMQPAQYYGALQVGNDMFIHGPFYNGRFYDRHQFNGFPSSCSHSRVRGCCHGKEKGCGPDTINNPLLADLVDSLRDNLRAP